MLLCTKNQGCTAWHMAANHRKLELLQEIWEWAKENLTTEEIKSKLLLAPDISGNTAWHLSVYSREPGVLQKIWEWAKENITTEREKN